MISWRVLFFKILISWASLGLCFLMVNKVMLINKKLTSIEVTIISIPKKKSPAKWEPNTPMLDITPARIRATYGDLFFGWILVICVGKMESFAHANISRDTDNNIAGKSFIKAIAAPKRIKTSSPLGKT